eukprot:COSAG04_NODE_214_length_20089_cov_206.678189_19_plen_1118_part_01
MAERVSLPEEAAEEHEQFLRDSAPVPAESVADAAEEMEAAEEYEQFLRDRLDSGQAQYDENTPEGAAPPADEMEDVRESRTVPPADLPSDLTPAQIAMAEARRRLTSIVAEGKEDEHGGLAMAKIQHTYKSKYKSPLDAKACGFAKLSRLLESMEGLVVDYCGPGTKSIVRLAGTGANVIVRSTLQPAQPSPRREAAPSQGGAPLQQQQPLPPPPPPPSQQQQPPAGRLDPNALAQAPPPKQKQMLGERLHPLVQRQQPDLAGKITGMLLELKNSEVLRLLDSQQELDGKIVQALKVLEEAPSPPQARSPGAGSAGGRRQAANHATGAARTPKMRMTPASGRTVPGPPPGPRPRPNAKVTTSAQRTQGGPSSPAAGSAQRRRQSATPRGARPEMRVDTDGRPYTRRQFDAQYRRGAAQRWNQAKVFDATQLQQQISMFAAELRSRLAGDDEYVSFERIMCGICKQFGVRRFEELNVGPFYDVDELRKLQALEDAMFARIESYVRCRCIATLMDLDEFITDDEEVSSFANLRIGPLIKHPLVKKYFQPAARATEIPDVSVQDVVKQLQTMMRRKRTPDKKFLTPDEILEQLARERELASPLDLCCRIAKHGIGRYIMLISDVQRKEMAALSRLRKELENDSARTVKAAKRQMEKLEAQAAKKDKTVDKSWTATVDSFSKVVGAVALENNAEGGSLALLIENMLQDGKTTNQRVRVKVAYFKRLAALAAAYITQQLKGETHSALSAELGMKVEDIHAAVEEAHSVVVTSAEPDEMAAPDTCVDVLARVESTVCADLGVMKFDALGSGGFLRFLQERGIGRSWGLASGGSEQDYADSTTGTKPIAVPLDDLILAFKAAVTNHDEGTSNLESRLCAQFGVRSFVDLGHGSLLEVLSSNASLGQLLANRQGWSSAPQAAEVDEFARQAARHAASNGLQLTAASLEACVCSHFKASLDQMGRARDEIFEQSSSTQAQDSGVQYWRARTFGQNKPGEASVGVAGWVSDTQAIEAIQCAPVLAKLQQHLLWDSAFAPSHGSFASFVSRHDIADCTILEIEPDHHTRIFADSSPKAFRESCFANDPRSAVAHLLSMFVRTGFAQKSLLVLYAEQALQKLGGTGSDRP